MKLLLIVAIACLLSSSNAVSPKFFDPTNGISRVSEDTKVETTSATIEPTMPIVTSDTVANTAVPADATVTSSDEIVRVKRGAGRRLRGIKI